LASNFGHSGRRVNTGDFTYDGVVNLADFNVLTGRYGQSIGPQPFASTGSGIAAAGLASRRDVDSLRDDLLG
jgi:hypothetical protein